MSCVIFGAGKIARGFIGHLLYLSGIPFTLIEQSDDLVRQLTDRKSYTVNILGSPEKNCVVTDFQVLGYSRKDRIIQAIAEADTVFDAVGGKNLEALVPFLAAGIEKKAAGSRSAAEHMTDHLNIVTCENWKNPAEILRRGIEKELPDEAGAYYNERVGITEAVIMRSAIEATEAERAQDPLIVNVQDYWQLHVDASRLKGPLPSIKGLHLLDSFDGFLEKKFYTYNAANGSVSYLGALLGYTFLADAAHDNRILRILDGVYRETSGALCQKYGFSFEEQWAFTRTSLHKLQDRTIVDYIERNARDPLRTLGPEDRLAASYGITPKNLCTAIAAAIFYTNEADPSAAALRRLREEEGIRGVISKVCRLDPDGDLGRLIMRQSEALPSLQKEQSD